MGSKDLIEECLEKGLLKKTRTDPAKVRGSLGLAEHFLGRAKGVLTQEYYDVAFLMAYNSMFHTARALLFSRGYSERSHYCMILLLKSEFEDGLGSYLDTLESYRLTRHSIQYRGGACSETDAKEAIDDAEEFMDKAKEVLK